MNRRTARRSLLVLAAIGTAMVWTGTWATADSAGHRTTVCKVAASAPEREQTVIVGEAAAQALLARTPSYPGRCAAKGPKSPLGDGWFRTYVQSERGAPTVVGIEFPASTLQNLPQEHTDGLRCYDVNGDGTVDPMEECAGGWARPLELPSAAGPPLNWALVNWNPHGHGAPGVYTYPHFDFHFYLQPKAGVDAIRPGPCGIVVHCDDHVTGTKPIPAQYLPPGYTDIGAVEVKMGNHLVDQSGPEWQGQPFMRTFIFGSYDGKVSFLEPMISKAFLEQVRTGQTPDGCYPVPQPQAWQAGGWYPQQYCITFRENRGDFTVALTGFRHT